MLVHTLSATAGTCQSVAIASTCPRDQYWPSSLFRIANKVSEVSLYATTIRFAGDVNSKIGVQFSLHKCFDNLYCGLSGPKFSLAWFASSEV